MTKWLKVEIWAAADEIILQNRGRAVEAARQKAEALLAEGEAGGHEVWRRILRAVSEIEGQARPGRHSLTASCHPVPNYLIVLVATYLKGFAGLRQTVDFRRMSKEIGLRPPSTPAQLRGALEIIILEDLDSGAPPLGALVSTSVNKGLPPPMFFALSRSKGRYEGPDRGPEATAYHAGELERVWNRWSG